MFMSSTIQLVARNCCNFVLFVLIKVHSKQLCVNCVSVVTIVVVQLYYVFLDPDRPREKFGKFSATANAPEKKSAFTPRYKTKRKTKRQKIRRKKFKI